jgi:hypothetical protein
VEEARPGITDDRDAVDAVVLIRERRQLGL